MIASSGLIPSTSQQTVVAGSETTWESPCQWNELIDRRIVMKCPKCHSKDIDFQESIGQSICVNCGTVVEENTIVSSVEFQETADRSHIVGQYVSASFNKPFTATPGRGMGRHTEGRDSREVTLQNAKRVITQVATSLRLDRSYIDRAYRLYQLALAKNFIFGRRQSHVVSTCLYIICRQDKSPHLLIDFSDALQINVFVLGKSFLQFSRVLNLNLPIVDPSLYIHRYATQLHLEDSVLSSVITTALRIVTRLKKDWIVTGRRPDGICAAAMLIACRSFGVHVIQSDLAALFRISIDTLSRRLREFKATPSAQLTLEQFHLNDLSMEYDPPVFIRNKQLEVSDVSDSDEDLASMSQPLSHQPSQLLSSDIVKDLESDEIYRVQLTTDPLDPQPVGDPVDRKRKPLHRSVKKEPPSSSGPSTVGMTQHVKGEVEEGRSGFRGRSQKQIHSLDERVAAYQDIYNEIIDQETVDDAKDVTTQLRKESEKIRQEVFEKQKLKKNRLKEKKLTISIVAGTGKTGGIGSTGGTGGGKMGMESLIEYEGEATGRDGVEGDDRDESLLEDEDLQKYLLNSEEREIRTQLWEKNFRGFLNERAARKQLLLQSGHLPDPNDPTSTEDPLNGILSSDRYTQSGKLRKKYAKKMKPSKEATTSEIVLAVGAKIRGSSRKINYEALKEAFGHDGQFALPATSVESAGVGMGTSSRGVREKTSSKVTSTGNSAERVQRNSNLNLMSGAVGIGHKSQKMEKTVVPATTAPGPPLSRSGGAVEYDEEDEEEDNLMYDDEEAVGMNDDYEEDYY